MISERAMTPGGHQERRRHLLQVREVAAYLSVTSDTVHRMCREREIPHIKIRNRLRFDPEEFCRWIAEHRRG